MKNQLKRVIVALLLLVLFTSQVGYYFIYTVHQFIIKEEIERELLSNIPDSSLEVIRAEQFGDKIVWEEEGREFSLNGILYDVARIEKCDGKTFLYCINDKKEKELLDNLARAVNKNHDNKKNQNNAKPVLPDLVFMNTADSPAFFRGASEFTFFCTPLVYSFKEIKIPPPKA